MGDEAVALIPDAVQGRSMLVRSLDMQPIECVVRGYLTGSGWAEYRAEGTVCGIPLPEGLNDGDRLPEPLYTPAFKAPMGEHDENITFERSVELVGAETASALRDLSLEIYRRASATAEARGLILADTKFEFGYDADGVLTLADEVLTSDSSRYWDAEAWRTGTTPAERMASFDKQIVRNWLAENWDKQGEPPALPAEIVERTRDRYAELLRLLTPDLTRRCHRSRASAHPARSRDLARTTIEITRPRRDHTPRGVSSARTRDLGIHPHLRRHMFRWKLHGNGRTVEPGAVVAPGERLNWGPTIAIGLQHVIAMFGATFLVPVLTGFPVSTTLLFSGVGTLLFLLITKNRLPSYLGSSFAFIAPITAATTTAGTGSALAGIVAVGVLLAVIGFIVQFVGLGWVDKVMPPVVAGAIVALIGSTSPRSRGRTSRCSPYPARSRSSPSSCSACFSAASSGASRSSSA